MAEITMKALLESGVHFGHRTQRWDPNMKPYIFTERNGIHIIDLQQTVKALTASYDLVRDLVAGGGAILFVGTKRQAADTIQEEAQRCGMPYVTVRWLGGMLTNWRTMRDRINELERLERMRERGEFDLLTKREALGLTRQIEKLEARFGGIRKLHGLPDMLFIVDVKREETAVREANILDIPVLALVDTNCDPRDIDHVIPSNDDAIRAIKLMVNYIASAVLEGRAMREEDILEEISPERAKAAQAEEAEELTDEELLGESTLAKMDAQAAAEAAAAEAKAKREEEERAALEAEGEDDTGDDDEEEREDDKEDDDEDDYDDDDDDDD